MSIATFPAGRMWETSSVIVDTNLPVDVMVTIAPAWQLMEASTAAMAVVWVMFVGRGVNNLNSSNNWRW